MSEEAKIHVGNLSFDTNEDELRDEFERYGRVTNVQIIRDRDTDKPKGYGFVTFEETDAAKDAIYGMDKKMFLGRPLKCEKARPRRSEGGYRAPRDSFDKRDNGRGFRDDRWGGRRDDFPRDDYRRDDSRRGGRDFGRNNRDNNRDFRRDRRY